MSPNVLCVVTKLYLTTTKTKHTQLITLILCEKGRGIGMAFATEKKKKFNKEKLGSDIPEFRKSKCW